ncbi:S5A-REDUCTASE domain-containing protein [Mycena kentingensis (nom. inval.)]|nr:S5A-REDUCTASE domain-containing protein [Mycena kentingensis (nom. inval.)]
MTVFSRLLPTAASSYALQGLFALIFVPQQNEKWYDLCGSIGFLTSTFASLYWPALKAKFWDRTLDTLPHILSFAPRQLLVNSALCMWTVRLGTFLASRAIKAGGDSRFDKVKTNPRTFTYFWLAQATWVLLTGLPIYVTNVIPAAEHPELGASDYAAIALFTTSFLFEVIADGQKTAWRRRKDAKLHDEKFITKGLWAISRHPNYVGEVGLWTGIWALAAGGLKASKHPAAHIAATAISPLFTWFLITKVSGVPPLEKAGDKKFGGDPKWEQYQKTVPVFWPWGSV